MLDELEDEMLFLDEVNRSENLTLDNITLEVNDNQSLTQVTIKWEHRGWKWDMREMSYSQNIFQSFEMKFEIKLLSTDLSKREKYPGKRLCSVRPVHHQWQSSNCSGWNSLFFTFFICGQKKSKYILLLSYKIAENK